MIRQIKSFSGSGATINLAMPNNVASGSTLLVFVSWYQVTTLTVTDSQGNTVTTLLGPQTHPSDTTFRAQIFSIAVGSSAADTVTLTFSSGSGFVDCVIEEHDSLGVATGTASITTGTTGTTSGNYQTVSCPAISPTVQPVLIVGWITTYRASSGLSTVPGGSYVLVSTSAPQNPQFNTQGGGNCGTVEFIDTATGAHTPQVRQTLNDLYIVASLAFSSTATTNARVSDFRPLIPVTRSPNARITDVRPMVPVTHLPNARVTDIRPMVPVDKNPHVRLTDVRQLVVVPTVRPTPTATVQVNLWEVD